MKPNRARSLSMTLLYVLLGLLVVLLLALQTEDVRIYGAPLALSIGVGTAYSIVLFRWWRCPHCGKRRPDFGLYARSHMITHCPYCGGAIDET